MSTKCSLAYGDDFHLYEEVFDDYHVYLSLEKAEFEASNNEVMVRIPLAIWEHIRQFTNARFDLIDFDDEALLKLTEKEVDERIEDYKINPSSLAGLLTFGKADTPRDQQIKNRMEYYINERNRQRSIKEKIDQLNEKR